MNGFLLKPKDDTVRQIVLLICQYIVKFIFTDKVLSLW